MVAQNFPGTFTMKLLAKLGFQYQDYIPKSFICWREGYTRQLFMSDLFAGVSVGVIALPLAIAFAIGSGVAPEKGLFTAIIAGFLISLLGGSRVQVSGPTGAFVIIIYGIVQRHGYDGLAITTLIAGVLMILMGLARLGILLKFIPYPVTTGFTTGIALAIFTGQIKDFLGLRLDKLPPEFLERCKNYCMTYDTWNPWAFIVATAVLFSIFALRRYNPRLPGVIIAIAAATFIAYYFGLPLETIESKYGMIPRSLPMPGFPEITYERIQTLFPEAISVALLGAIESLLSAVVADGMTGYRHRSNCELVAQGIGNLGSILFGGIPATGAIARTTANIRLGGKTPMSGMIHAVTILLLMIAFAPLAAKIPLCALSAVLIFVAWNMSELHHFAAILKGPRHEAIVMIVTFLFTVLVDLVVAVQIGVILAAGLFLKHLTDSTTVQACKVLIDENAHEHPELHDSDVLFRKDIPDDVTIFEIKGPFFYSVADLLEDTLNKLERKPRVFILRMRHVPVVDMTGIKALKNFAARCKKENIEFILSGVRPEIMALFNKTNFEATIGKENFFPHIDKALSYTKI